MKDAVEMGSGAMIYAPSFRHSKFNREVIHRYTYTRTHRMEMT
jgi:hypothetical protein